MGNENGVGTKVSQSPSIAANPRLLRQLRIARGWTQEELGKRAGYTGRLIRKAESGGRVRTAALADIAQCLSTTAQPVTVELLSHDPLQVAQLWMNSFDQYGVDMLSHIRAYMADDFVFQCAGNVTTFPFNGTFHGIEGHQQWLDAFFSCFVRQQGIDVTYTSGPDCATSRWLETVFMHGILCPPVRVNLHFFFRDALLIRIEDDYDTQAGAEIHAAILEHLGKKDHDILKLPDNAWRPGEDVP